MIRKCKQKLKRHWYTCLSSLSYDAVFFGVLSLCSCEGAATMHGNKTTQLAAFDLVVTVDDMTDKRRAKQRDDNKVNKGEK